MARALKPVDAVTIGVGLTGSLAALELAKQGLKVVGLERGASRDTVPDFQSPAIHDELRFSIRKAMMQDNVKVAVTSATTPTICIRSPGGIQRHERCRASAYPSCTSGGAVLEPIILLGGPSPTPQGRKRDLRTGTRKLYSKPLLHLSFGVCCRLGFACLPSESCTTLKRALSGPPKTPGGFLAAPPRVR
jgi:hypothetical protein